MKLLLLLLLLSSPQPELLLLLVFPLLFLSPSHFFLYARTCQGAICTHSVWIETCLSANIRRPDFPIMADAWTEFSARQSEEASVKRKKTNGTRYNSQQQQQERQQQQELQHNKRYNNSGNISDSSINSLPAALTVHQQHISDNSNIIAAATHITTIW